MEEENNLSGQRLKSGWNNNKSTFSEMIELFPTGFFVLNQEEYLLDINKAGEIIIGKEKKEIISKKFSGFIIESEKNQFNALLEKARKTSQTQVKELKIKAAGSNYLPALIIAKYSIPQGSSSGSYFLTIIDFTQQK